MKICNLVVSGSNWLSSALYTNLDDAIKEVGKMVDGQKYLEGGDNVDVHEIRDYEALSLPFDMSYGVRKYAVETRSMFMGKMTTMWRVVYEQETK